MSRGDEARAREWRTGFNIPQVSDRHRKAAAWALDRAPDGLTWDGLTAAHVTPDRLWQARRVAEAFARFERDLAASQPTGEMPGREEECERLRAALSGLLDEVDADTCLHETRHRGGAIWTICSDCGAKWADDRGGFKPHVDSTAITAARSALLTPAPSATGEAGNGVDAVLLRAFRFIDGVAGDMNGSPPEEPYEDADDLAMDIADVCGVPFDEHWPEAVVAALREAARQSRQGNEGGGDRG